MPSPKDKGATSSTNDNATSVISQNDSNLSGVSSADESATDKKTKKPKSNADTGRMASKGKPKSADGSTKKSKSKPKSKADTSSTGTSKSKAKSGDHGSKKAKSKKKSADGRRSKSKAKSSHRKKKEKKHHSKHAKAEKKLTTKEKKHLGSKVCKIEAMKGAISVSSEKAIVSAGYVVESAKLYQSEYSQVMRAKKSGMGGLVVKVVNLAECSPRAQTNLLHNSVRIMRYVGTASDKKKEGTLSPLFVSIRDIFLVGSCRLFIFMAECAGQRSLYDLVKSSKALSAGEIRNWFKAIVAGVHELQKIGVAHRAVKVQHILFDAAGKPKLVGWSKSVFFYDAKKKHMLLQRKERRVRRNYHLPPEAFMGSYDPAKADIWSLGVALVAMASKRYPFNVRDKKTKFSSQWRQFVKNHEMNTYVRNLCHKTFIIDPKRRITTDAILGEKYFTVAEEKISMLTCKADTIAVREDSRVGGMSTVDLGSSAKSTAVEPAKQPQVEVAEEEEVNWEEEAKADESGVDEDATGNEGGNVGEEENLPAAEQEEESQMAEKNAPEESEAEAQPEDGGEADEATGEEGEEGEQTEEEAAEE